MDQPTSIIILCYRNRNDGTQKFEAFHTNPKDTIKMQEDLDEWRKENPDLEIIHAFSQNSDILTDKNHSREWFEANCRKYGLEPEYYGAFLNDGSKIIGIRTQNVKYPILLWNPNTGRNLMSTPKYVQRT